MFDCRAATAVAPVCVYVCVYACVRVRVSVGLTCVHRGCELLRRTRQHGGETPTGIVPRRERAADYADRGGEGGGRLGDELLNALGDKRRPNLK